MSPGICSGTALVQESLPFLGAVSSRAAPDPACPTDGFSASASCRLRIRRGVVEGQVAQLAVESEPLCSLLTERLLHRVPERRQVAAVSGVELGESPLALRVVAEREMQHLLEGRRPRERPGVERARST